MWVRGLKHNLGIRNAIEVRSHPMWVRGLKPIFKSWLASNRWSHPMWVRGLKHREDFYQPELDSRTLCGCVD